MQAGERAVCSSIQDRQIMRLGHALLSVFVGQDCGSRGVKMRVVIGMVEMPVGVDDEFAVGTVEDYHGSAGTVEHSEIVSELLHLHGNGIKLDTETRE